MKEVDKEKEKTDKTIQGMTEYWGAELARNVARHYQAEIEENMLAVLASRCGGNPFYITAVIMQSREQEKAITNENVLDELLAMDLASGFIWGELSDQVNRWLERINEFGISKWILYLAALEEEEQGSDVSLEIDVYAGAGTEHWIAESKWRTDRQVNKNEVEEFLELKPLVFEYEGKGLKHLQMWFFSHSGFNAEAEKLLQNQGVLYSDKGDLNALLDLAGLRRLPEM